MYTAEGVLHVCQLRVAPHALQSGERTLLKNLGSWLGLLTIKQNRMVMQKDLDVKGLMFEAYEQVRATSDATGHHRSACSLAVMPCAFHPVFFGVHCCQVVVHPLLAAGPSCAKCLSIRLCIWHTRLRRCCT